MNTMCFYAQKISFAKTYAIGTAIGAFLIGSGAIWKYHQSEHKKKLPIDN